MTIPLRRLKSFGTGPQIFKKFYSSNIESCITDWYGNCSASDSKVLQRVECMAQCIAGAKLPAIQDLYTRRCQKMALKIAKDSSLANHRLFSLLQHGCKGFRLPPLTNSSSRKDRRTNAQGGMCPYSLIRIMNKTINDNVK